MSKFSNSKKIYTVHVEKKSAGGLGFLLRQRHEMPYLGVWEILKNGSAEKCGLIRKGDIILKVNKHDLSATSYEKGLETIRSIKSDSIVELTLMQNDENEKLNGLRNGLMSPIVKFRKKFMSCATENNFKKDSIPDHTNETVKAQCDNNLDIQKPAMNNSDTQCNLINDIEPLTPKCLNSIQIIQHGDDIRIKLYDGLEIVTNCTNEKRVICLSPKIERKVMLKENELDELKNEKKDKISNKNCVIDNNVKSIDLNKTNSNNELSPTKQKKKKGLKLKYLIDESNNIDLLHHKAYTVIFFSRKNF